METNIYILLGGIVFFATAIVVWDVIPERVKRKAHKH